MPQAFHAAQQHFICGAYFTNPARDLFRCGVPFRALRSTAAPCAEALLSEESVELFKEYVYIVIMDLSSLFERLAGGSRAADALHTHFKEYGSRVHIEIEYLFDSHIFVYFCHCDIYLSYPYGRMISFFW